MAGGRARVAIIGTGAWVAQTHLPGLRSRADVEVVALCGRRPEPLAALAAAHGVPRTFTDWRALVAEGRAGRLDAVVICTPNALHHAQARAALDAGLHVVCEKPLCLDAGEAADLARRAAEAGRATLTFFTHRAVAASAEVKRRVAQGDLGRPVQVSAQYFTNSHLRPGKRAGWRMVRAEAGTGVLGDIGSHLVDLVRWWLGGFAAVAGQWQTITPVREGVRTDADEAVSFLADLACGAQGTFHASKLVAGRGNLLRVELHGTAGSLVWEAEPGLDPTWEGRLWAGRPEATRLEPVALAPALTSGLDGADPQENRNAAYRRLTDPFFAALRGEPGPHDHPSFADGAAVQAVLDAVARSAEERRWVGVDGEAA
jgi:predicted dehydrogenase